MDIGKTLQDARIAKNLSLDTVAQETNIRKIYLEAVENNDFAALSGDVFVKGVMRTYGNYLGLDGAKLVEEYKAASAGNVPVKNNNTIRESQHVKVRPSFKSNRDIGSGTGSSHKLLYAIIGSILALLLAAGGIYFYLARSGQAGQLSLPFFASDNNIANNDVKSDSNQKNAAASKNNNSIMNKIPVKDAADKKAAATQEKSVNKPVGAGDNSIASDTENDKRSGFTVLTLTSTGKCWLHVAEQNGNVLFEGNLLKGESRKFSSKSNIIVRFGNLKDMNIEYNGKTLPAEATMEPVTRTYTPAGEGTK